MSILGTDINREFLARGRRGPVRGVGVPLHAARVEDDVLRAVGEFVAWSRRGTANGSRSSTITWSSTRSRRSLDNLFAFDLILCRNVTIYFSQDVVRKIVGHFHQCLVDGGWLAVGHAEPNVETFRPFRTVNADGATLYQKSQEAAAGPDWLSWSPGPPVAPRRRGRTDRPPRRGRLSPEPAPAPSASSRPTLAAVRRPADRGDLDGASAACRALIGKNRLDPAAHFYHALILEQMGRHAETEQALRRAIYLDRDFTLAHYYLGLLQQKQGATALAARSFRNVLDLLSRKGDGSAVLDADGMTVADLRALTRGHLEVLQGGMNGEGEGIDGTRSSAARRERARAGAVARRRRRPSGSRLPTPAGNWPSAAAAPRKRRRPSRCSSSRWGRSGTGFRSATWWPCSRSPTARRSPARGRTPGRDQRPRRGPLRARPQAHPGTPRSPSGGSGYILLVRHDDRVVGLRVDSLEKAERVATGALITAAEWGPRPTADFSRG